MKEQILKFLESCPKLWRTRRIKAVPEYLEYLGCEYPNVSLNLQIDSILHNRSPYCVVCHGVVKSLGKITCSVACRTTHSRSIDNQAQRIIKQQKTLLKKYGVRNIRQIPGVETKRKATLLHKYNAMVSPLTRKKAKERAGELNAKGKLTIQEKYGVSNAGQIPGHGDKCKETLITNFGVDSYYKSDIFQQKAEAKRNSKWASFLPSTITFNGLVADNAKKLLFSNPNQILHFVCTTCNTCDSAPTETIKWRITNTGTCCKKCGGFNTGSLKESAVRSFIESLGVTVQANVKLLDGKEIDIWLPELKLGFEFHGLFWHNDLRVERNYHVNKLTIANTNNITLIQIFEDEWDHHPEIVKSRIRYLLGQIPTKLFARQCVIKEVDYAVEKEFLDKHHIQGHSKSSVKVGLYHNNLLISLMTFSKPNLSKGLKKRPGWWELLRFCSQTNTTVVGGANKMFKYFISTYSPEGVLSFADSRWSKGMVYNQLGFTANGHTGPNYWYINLKEGKRIHRFALRKNKNDDQSLSEADNRRMQGYLRIWDCGSSKWTWTKK